MADVLFTFGYAHYATNVRMHKLVAALRDQEITYLVDIRHSPCAAQVNPDSNYGPKPWNLQVVGGLSTEVERVGVRYYWQPQLGNPQKNDPDMAVLRAHLAAPESPWPVNLGLVWLAEKIQASDSHRLGILCACGQYATCHRKLIAETLNARHFGGHLQIVCPR